MPWSSGEFLELFVVLCTADGFRYAACKFRTASTLAESKSGPVRPDSMPTQLSVLIGPVQGLTCVIVPIAYIFTLIYHRMQQPGWMNALALPEIVSDTSAQGTWRNALRVLACVTSIASRHIADEMFKHLGDQYHAIGRREKSRVVQTGPYAWVRHPLYSSILVQYVFFGFMFWSYLPLFMLVPIAIMIAVKIPIEEEAIQRDEATREAYRAYMKKVPWKVVPYAW